MQYYAVIQDLTLAGCVPLADETETQRICDYWVHVDKQELHSLIVYPSGDTSCVAMAWPGPDDLRAMLVFQYGTSGFAPHEAVQMAERRYHALFAQTPCAVAA